MATMNISLPDTLKQWACNRKGYSNASDYVRELIRRDQERTARLAHLQNLLDEGIASGVSPLSAEDVFANAKAKYDQQTAL
ncbi:MAG: type II toxin-antitoxin system ParD family antitoxin [Hyphomicrobium sp.]|jgi:antitoxin ParD1/3/4|uniref:type II toxin-antitoxin system ParD family antitoxin n=1 Tax=Hyphomicrobium sp. DMF-1 TaxID=3019544 RepID=UPI000BD1A6E5|nr:type II toxin-antitoxin system ParD family antitoxin [Hyphomicrobium sp. DMF-1]OYW53661.1 MAG: CopG family transcriptional regulator [Hyphomicrobium sp. 12-62-95]OYX98396.1 MAG: CopG family transcriptional regulator [Hyphomicrobium sp. 32-62-53]WBT37911.1 type II toxin-antitoxin system ParD family antitoxin [Hyphomicrobium sp. DMF-1]